MASTSKWFRSICGLKKEQYCHNCKNKISINETKTEIIVNCSLYGGRVLKFSRHNRSVCGAWKENKLN